jgi:hypothetical protein
MSLEQAIEQNTRAVLEMTRVLNVVVQLTRVSSEAALAGTPQEVVPAPEQAAKETPIAAPAPTTADTPIDADTVRDAFIAFARTHGRAGQLEALAQFGVAKLGELPESSYGDMIHFLKHYTNLHHGVSNA